MQGRLCDPLLCQDAEKKVEEQRIGEGGWHTSSLLDPMLSRAIGLLGALLAVGAASGAEVDWGTGDTPRVWVAAMLPRVVERYCFTCCLCACWMWYLVGFSKWVWTCSQQDCNSYSLRKFFKKTKKTPSKQGRWAGMRQLLLLGPPQAPVLEVDGQHLVAA